MLVGRPVKVNWNLRISQCWVIA